MLKAALLHCFVANSVRSIIGQNSTYEQPRSCSDKPSHLLNPGRIRAEAKTQTARFLEYSGLFKAQLKAFEMKGSMSRNGDYWDNVVTETLFGSLKVERLHGMRFVSVRAE